MREHPIEGLMCTAMNSISEMIDVNTIIGEPIETSNNIIIIPISKVGFGFAAGGSEFSVESTEKYSKKCKEEEIEYTLPFGGGSGAGISIKPMGFITIRKEDPQIKFVPIEHKCSMDKILDYMPDLMEKVSNMIEKMCYNKDNDEDKSSPKITYEFKYGDRNKDNSKKDETDEDE